MNPRPPDCKSNKTPTVSYNLPLDWSKFKVWLKNRFSSSYARDVYSYARKYYAVLLHNEVSELLSLNGNKRRMVMSSLSNLSKFLGLYKKWKRIVEDYGLKWSQNNAEDYIISRMANSQVQKDITCWIRQVKLNLPRLCYFMDFALCSGLRFSETINSYNLIVELARKGELKQYYNMESEVLEHFRFKQFFIRKTKKAFITFMPKAVVLETAKQAKLSKWQIENCIKRAGFKLRFGDIREYWATFMTKWLTQPEIDFLQGRVSSTVFMRNYFNPALITDLKQRVFKGVKQLLKLVA